MAKILLVDDAIVTRVKLKSILTSQGHEIIESGNGNDALKKLKVILLS
jgi:CheY-like chemotaxis protein